MQKRKAVREALVAEGRAELAVETALRIMETNSRLYEEEFLGEREELERVKW